MSFTRPTRPMHPTRAAAYRQMSDFDRNFNRSPFSRIPLVVRIAVALVFIAVFAIFAVIGVNAFSSAGAAHSISEGCKVTDKDRTTDEDGYSDMRIYTKGCNGSPAVKVFQVPENPFNGLSASANIYASIEIGKTYDFETRPGFLTTFDSIVSFTQVMR